MTNKGVAETEEDKAVDADLKAITEDTPKRVEAKMDELRVADAITEIFVLFKRCNKYIDETMPWALAKEEAKKDRLETVLYNLIESIKTGARLLESFMPETSEKILAQLGDGKVTEKPEILFARLDVNEVMKKVEELHPHVEEKEEAKEEKETVKIPEEPVKTVTEAAVTTPVEATPVKPIDVTFTSMDDEPKEKEEPKAMVQIEAEDKVAKNEDLVPTLDSLLQDLNMNNKEKKTDDPFEFLGSVDF